MRCLKILLLLMMAIYFLGRPTLMNGEDALHHLYSVCSLLKERNTLNGKAVTLTATIVGDRHSAILEGAECGEGIFLIHKSGQLGDKWLALDNALVRKSTGLDRRILHVKVRGIYHDAVLDGEGRIRQLEVTDVLEVWFEDSNSPAGLLETKPHGDGPDQDSSHAGSPSQH